ncbi:MAG: PilZ domain-containing protein [Phycisphaerae bacterium]
MTPDSQTKAQPLTFAQWKRILARIVAPEFERNMNRKFRRYAVPGEVTAHFVKEDREYKRSWPLLEVSAEGITAKAFDEIPSDTRVTIELDFDDQPHLLTGTVVHCTETLGGHKIGIRLDFPDNPAEPA